MNKKIIWRTIARIDGEIIIKQSQNRNRAIKSARNAVCQRLCNVASINYKLGWYKGIMNANKVEFVDRFLGDTLQIMEDDPIDLDLHNVPFELYTIPKICKLFTQGSTYCPENIDSWGNLHYGSGDGDKFQLLGTEILIPPTETITKSYEEEEVLAIIDAQSVENFCPNCKSDLPFGTIAIITETYTLLPTVCCSKMQWSVNDKNIDDKWS